MTKEKIAFVVARYGLNINGGAEYHCRMLAERLVDDYDVEVLTTCVENYRTGGNIEAKEEETINNVHVKRFKADPIHPELEECYKKEAKPAYKLRKFLYKCRLLAPISFFCPIWHYKEKEELKLLNSQVFYSSTLFDYIKKNKDNYKAIIPITLDYPHVYYTTLYAPEKTIIIPTMHYHKVAFRSILTKAFTKAAYIGFNTTAEQKLAERIFGMHMSPHNIISVGIEIATPTDWEITKQKYNLPNEYLLYVGRVDQGKLNKIFSYFMEYKKKNPTSKLKFVLVGKQYSEPFIHPDIIYTNFVEEGEKIAIIQHAKIVINPSQCESLSLILLEAMTLKKAMLVNGNCNVLKEHCLKSNHAALYYTNQHNFIKQLQKLDFSDALRDEMSKKGVTYIAKNYNWDVIMNRLKKVIENI